MVIRNPMPMGRKLATFLFIVLTAFVALAPLEREPVPQAPDIQFSDVRFEVLANRSFWRTSGSGPYRAEAELIGTSPIAYWYIEVNLTRQGLNYTPATMTTIMDVFEDIVTPRLHSALGYEPLPPDDVDGDPRVTVLITTDVSYFDPRNEAPATTEPISNECEMVYVEYETDPDALLALVAHEFAHLIEWNYDPSEQGWIGEGIASVATRIAGYDTGAPPVYLQNTSVGLWSGRFHWGASYGAWELFIQYLADQFGGWTLTRTLTQNPLQGVLGVEDTLDTLGHAIDFRSLFRDWMVANLVNNATTTDGLRFRYANMTERATITYSADQYPWSASIPVENAGIAYVGLPAGQSVSAVRISLPNASASAVMAVLVVQQAGSLQLESARAQGRDLELEAGPWPTTAHVALAVAYLNESGVPEVSAPVRVANAPNDEVSLVPYVVLGAATAVVVALLIVLGRRRKKIDPG